MPICLGTYDSPPPDRRACRTRRSQEIHELAYDRAAFKLRGEYACLNFPGAVDGQDCPDHLRQLHAAVDAKVQAICARLASGGGGQARRGPNTGARGWTSGRGVYRRGFGAARRCGRLASTDGGGGGECKGGEQANVEEESSWGASGEMVAGVEEGNGGGGGAWTREGSQCPIGSLMG